MKEISAELLEQKLKHATAEHLEMARNSCWNTISDNTFYIISEIKNEERNKRINRAEKHKNNVQKSPMTLAKAANEIKPLYFDLYDINLEIFQSKSNSTIINIRYYPKSALDADFYTKVKNDEPMVHCKIIIPPYATTKKFDVNWQHSGLRHKWNSFWYRITNK